MKIKKILIVCFSITYLSAACLGFNWRGKPLVVAKLSGYEEMKAALKEALIELPGSIVKKTPDYIGYLITGGLGIRSAVAMYDGMTARRKPCDGKDKKNEDKKDF
jgi:hypothetical protein